MVKSAPAQMSWFEVHEKSAVISECGRYRYRLTRGACHGMDYVNFLMLNPSTADHENDDPTIKRCKRFARDASYGDLVVTNLFAWRSSDPEALATAPDPIGPENDRYILETAKRAALVICAWGAEPFAIKRAKIVRAMLVEAGVKLFRLSLTNGGHPGHPLFLKGDLRPVEWV